MKYYETETDVSFIYRPSSAAGSADLTGTAVAGTLSDLMRNATLFQEVLASPTVVYVNEPKRHLTTQPS